MTNGLLEIVEGNENDTDPAILKEDVQAQQINVQTGNKKWMDKKLQEMLGRSEGRHKL